MSWLLSKPYLIGTRASLLAMTQAHLIKQKLQTLTGKRFQLKSITTQGDREQSTALWQLPGQDFFTKELDQALLNGTIDLALHSYKDLGHVRPEGLSLAALTERRYGEDILLINKQVLARSRAGSVAAQKSTNSPPPLVVGTSSPRRVANAEAFLASFLPAGLCSSVECKELRGNVNTRLQKLLAGHYDAIVLALAGLERLATHPPARKQLIPLLQGLEYMILPSSRFPSAAGQGALALEIKSQRDDEGQLQDQVQRLHHRETAAAMERERKHIKRWGGGCHLAVGVQVEQVAGHFVHFQQGEAAGRRVAANFIEDVVPQMESPFFLGLPKEQNPYPRFFLADHLVVKTPQEPRVGWNAQERGAGQCSFITSRHCLAGWQKTHPHPGGVNFTSGLKTWQAMAQEGHWVNGSSDGLGHEKLHHYLDSQALALFHGALPLVTYSAHQAQVAGELVACYRRETQEVEANYFDQLSQVRTFFWTSYPQFELFSRHFPQIPWPDRLHCCGMGKTFQEFKKRNIKATPFLSTGQFIREAQTAIKIA